MVVELGFEVFDFTGGRLETIEVRRGVKMAYSGGRCVERYLLLCLWEVCWWEVCWWEVCWWEV